MSKTKQLVNTLFVKVEDQDDDSWYSTASTVNQLVTEDISLVGEYRLVKTFSAKSVPQIITDKPKKARK